MIMLFFNHAIEASSDTTISHWFLAFTFMCECEPFCVATLDVSGPDITVIDESDDVWICGA